MALVHTRPFSVSACAGPWFAWLAPFLSRFAEHDAFPSPLELTALYRERAAATGAPPLTFVPSPPKAKRRKKRAEPIVLAEGYEGGIVERGEVSTREGDWHDLFNALAFCSFPRAKWALHARQYAIQRARVSPTARRLPGSRTREQDALALFDEGGLALCLSGAERASLPADEDARAARLSQLFAGGALLAVPFGHALYEHLMAGLPPPLAYPHFVDLDEDGRPPVRQFGGPFGVLDRLDRELERALSDPGEFARPHGGRGLSLDVLSARG